MKVLKVGCDRRLVSCRLYYSSGTWSRPQSSHAALLDKYWIKLQMGTMAREELKKVHIKSWLHSVDLFLLVTWQGGSA